MDREKLLAAETFSYSYANYANHLGIGHVRFEELMPQDVRILEQAEQEGWPLKKLAQALECNEDIAERFRVSYIRAKDIIRPECRRVLQAGGTLFYPECGRGRPER